MLRGLAESGDFFALREEDSAPAGAASVFLTDWTPSGSFAVTFQLGDAWEEQVDVYGAPPPVPGGAWARLTASVALQRTPPEDVG